MKLHYWLAAVVGLMMMMNYAVAQAPDGVSVQAVRAFGQGCPVGSTAATVAPDGSAFSLILDNYVATAEPGGRPTVRRDCDIEVDLNIPAGWSFAVIAADYRGFVDIPSGSLAQHRVVYTFDKSDRMRGQYPFSFQGTEFRGPMSQDYNVHHEIGVSAAPKSSCSFGDVKTLFLNTLLTARAMRGKSQPTTIALDSVDGQVAAQQYKLAWFRCDQFNQPGNPGRDPRQPPPGRGGGGRGPRRF